MLRSGDVVGQLPEDRGLRAGADDRLDDLAARVDRHGRDRHNLVVASDLRVLVDVYLGNSDLAGVLTGDLLENGSDLLTRSAPLGPEVDEYGAFGLQHVGREARVGDDLGVLAHRYLFSRLVAYF